MSNLWLLLTAVWFAIVVGALWAWARYIERMFPVIDPQPPRRTEAEDDIYPRWYE